MILQNKKTGVLGVLEATTYHGGRPDNIVEVYEMGIGAVRVLAQYKTLEELLGEWKDYKPAEPLIRDEKVRKAVRAWAELSGVDKCHFEHDDGSFAGKWYGISLPTSKYGEDIESGFYAIDELCGEEEG